MTVINLSASIHQRLLNKAASERRPFSELLQYYANERFLFRLGKSPYSQQFILKGAFVFLAWQAPLTRPTRDLDFLGYTENSVENLVQIVRKICVQPVEPDGVSFDSDSVEGEIINEDADYQGVRIKFHGYLGKARIDLRLDTGFADIVTPRPVELEIPPLLDGIKKPIILAYPPESVIAEKFQAMVELGLVNSRMKDFYDLWFLANSMAFEAVFLHEALTNTFKRRNTVFPQKEPIAFTGEFAALKQGQWEVFLRKNRIVNAPMHLSVVIKKLEVFFKPLIQSDNLEGWQWSPASGWHH
jgi:hypothetical protein